jgi:trehalose-6-phosphatase
MNVLLEIPGVVAGTRKTCIPFHYRNTEPWTDVLTNHPGAATI